MAQHPNKKQAISKQSNRNQRKQSSTQQGNTLAEEMANKSTDGNIGSNANAKTYNLLVDDVPYIVKAVPFSFNGEQRFYISVNGGAEHVFTWDSDIRGLRAIDDSSGELPDAVEGAISQKLQSTLS